MNALTRNRYRDIELIPDTPESMERAIMMDPVEQRQDSWGGLNGGEEYPGDQADREIYDAS